MRKIILFSFIFAFLIAGVHAETNITGCGTLDIDGETYVLQNDINVDYTIQNGCFRIYGEHLTLDMNGNTIYFVPDCNPASGGSCSMVQMGFHISDYTDDQSADGSQIKNGNFVQTQDVYTTNAEYPLITFNCDNCSMNGVYLYSWGSNVQSIDIGGKNTENNVVEIYNNTIINNETEIDYTELQDGAIVVGFLNSTSDEAYGHAIFHNNTISGRAYLIDYDGWNTEGRLARMTICNNKFYPYKVSRNPYAIRMSSLAPGIGTEIYNNTIISDDSRGILIAGSSGVKIYNNYIQTSEVHIDGVDDVVTYGVRLRYGADGAWIVNNTIVVWSHAATGMLPAKALSFSHLAPGAEDTIVENNTLKAYTDDPSLTATAFLLEAGDASNLKIKNNIFQGNSYGLRFGDINCGDLDAIFNADIISSTFIRESPLNGATVRSFTNCVNGNYNNRIIDARLVDEASLYDIIYFGENYNELEVYYYLDVLVQDELNNPIVAEVQIYANNGSLVYDGNTNAYGTIPQQTLLEFYESGDSPIPMVRVTHSPYTVNVTYNGEIQTQNITLNESQQAIFTFTSSNCTLAFDEEPCDDCINTGELGQVITAWYENSIGISELMQNIKIWKQCG